MHSRTGKKKRRESREKLVVEQNGDVAISLGDLTTAELSVSVRAYKWVINYLNDYFLSRA